MTKKLILMRHADAAKLISVNDFNRPLSSMGQRQAELAADFIVNIKIDQVLVSPTKRTTETLELVLPDYLLTNIEIVEAIYNESDTKIIQIIAERNNKIDTLMLIGHNPTISQLALNLIEHNTTEFAHISSLSMSVAQLIIIEFKNLNNWNNIKTMFGKGKVLQNFTPNIDE